MVIYIDIDETICHSPDTMDYTKSFPIKENIKKANKLYDDGNEIIYWTARGMKSGLNWEDLTSKQLKEWNVKYHDVKFKKPLFDLFIDDKVMNSKDWV